MFKEFACTGEVAQLFPGDLLTVFSDGVTEATINGDEDFGRERAEAVIIAHRDRPPRELMDILFSEITGYLKGAPNSDDTTLVIVRRCREWTEPS